MSWPVKEGSTWEVRYYDSIEKPSMSCKLAAQTLLCVLSRAGLGVTEALPEPCIPGAQEDWYSQLLIYATF